MKQRTLRYITRRESLPQSRWSIRRSLPTTILGFGLFFLSLVVAFETPSHADSPSTLSLSMHNQQFSAQILRAPLEHVLTTLNSYRHFRFTIQGNAKNDLISASFLHLSLLESLERLLLGYDYAIIQHRLDSPSSPSRLPFLMEVVILSRNSAQPLSRETRPSGLSSLQTSTQSVLLRANQILEQPHKTKSLDLMSEHGSGVLREMVEEAIQDSDPESRNLLEELLKE